MYGGTQCLDFFLGNLPYNKGENEKYRMAAITKITSKCQITIPKEVWAEMGLREGDLVQFEPDGSGAYRITRYRCEARAEGILQPFISKGKPAPTVEKMNDGANRYLAEKFKTVKSDRSS